MLQQIEDQRKQSEQLKAPGNVWVVNTKGREDEAVKVMNRVLNANKATAKLTKRSSCWISWLMCMGWIRRMCDVLENRS